MYTFSEYISDGDMAFQSSAQSKLQQRLAKPLCTAVAHTLQSCVEQDLSAHTELNLRMPLRLWFLSLTPHSCVPLLPAPTIFSLHVFFSPIPVFSVCKEGGYC